MGAALLPVHERALKEFGLFADGNLIVFSPTSSGSYAAPVAFITSPDLALWMVGPTWSLKSELAALAQRHFGHIR